MHTSTLRSTQSVAVDWPRCLWQTIRVGFQHTVLSTRYADAIRSPRTAPGEITMPLIGSIILIRDEPRYSPSIRDEPRPPTGIEMATKFEINTEVPRPQILHRLRWNVRMMLGSFAARLQGPINEYVEYRRIHAHYEKFYENSRTDRLSDEEIDMWSTRINSENHIKDRRELFQTTPVNQTAHGIVVDLIDSLIEYDPSVHSVLEVGVYWGYVLNHLACKYPEVEFTGIDLARDTPVFNAEFKQKNVHFIAGYALDMLEQEKVASDVVFFNATATRFRVNEMKRFLRAIAKKGCYVVVSEPLIHLPGGLVIDPARLPLNESRPTTLTSPEWPPQYVHNYKGLAEEAGFKILHYRVYEPTFWRGIHRIDLVAVKERAR